MMNHARSGLIALVFLAGCAVGGASSQFVVPKANAQNVERWDYLCFSEDHWDAYIAKTKQAGSEGWEMVTAIRGGGATCFKRPM